MIYSASPYPMSIPYSQQAYPSQYPQTQQIYMPQATQSFPQALTWGNGTGYPVSFAQTPSYGYNQMPVYFGQAPYQPAYQATYQQPFQAQPQAMNWGSWLQACMPSFIQSMLQSMFQSMMQSVMQTLMQQMMSFLPRGEQPQPLPVPETPICYAPPTPLVTAPVNTPVINSTVAEPQILHAQPTQTDAVTTPQVVSEPQILHAQPTQTDAVTTPQVVSEPQILHAREHRANGHHHSTHEYLDD